MNRLKATNSVPFGSADVAPAGTPQYATNGNALSSVPATVIPAYMQNMIQDELMAIITAAGITADDTNWSQVAEALSGAIANFAAVSVTAADVTLTAAQYRCGVIVCSGALTGNRNVIFPVKGKWKLINNCTGAFTLTAKTAAGTGVVINQGCLGNVIADGANISSAAFCAPGFNTNGGVTGSVAENTFTTLLSVASSADIGLYVISAHCTLVGDHVVTLLQPVCGSGTLVLGHVMSSASGDAVDSSTAGVTFGISGGTNIQCKRNTGAGTGTITWSIAKLF